MDFSHLLTKYNFPFPLLGQISNNVNKVFWGLVNTSEFPFMGPIGKLMREADISQGRGLGPLPRPKGHTTFHISAKSKLIYLDTNMSNF
jgi:hypothetical protein